MRLTISTKSVTKELEELLKVTGGQGGSVIIGSLQVTIITPKSVKHQNKHWLKEIDSLSDSLSS